jgi:SAM-dependent methyltransferase
MSELRTRIRRALPILVEINAVRRLLTTKAAYKMECPCCGQQARFRSTGLPPRLNALCPNCGSFERHRLLHLFLNNNPAIFNRSSVLHFAPEPAVRQVIEPKAVKYVACDIEPGRDVVKIDIENIDLPSETFDLVICLHVLEHVDDAAALAEIYRVLKPGGTALLMFPIIEGWDRTLEIPAVTTPEDRLRYFGQEDHVRYFGRDVRDRIRAAGFDLSEFTAEEPDVSRYGLLRGEKIFVARRPAALRQ